MLNVVCINAANYQGRGVEYVNNLHRMVKANLSIPHRFIVFADEIRAYDQGIEFRPLQGSAKGWWNKISLFKPGLFEQGDRVLYFDLSVVIMGNIDDLAAYDGPFCMTQTFGGAGAFGGLQSSVMAWEAGGDGLPSVIFTEYLLEGSPNDFPGGDQAFIESLGKRCAWTKTDTWAEICPGKVVSYKWGLSGEYDGKASVIVFHGHPKPHEIGGWAYEAWLGDKAEEQAIELIRPIKFIDVCNTSAPEILQNIKANTGLAVPRVHLTAAHEAGAVIVGGGPSVADYIDQIRAKQLEGAKVFALNGTGEWLARNGVVPDYQVILDARPDNIAFLHWAASQRPINIQFLLASQCDQSLFRLLTDAERDVALWHVNDSEEGVAFTKENDPGSALISLGVTVGITVLNLAWTMGFRKADLYGYDSSSTGEDMHHAYPQPLNDKALTGDYVFEGKTYRAQRALASQANHFVTFYQMWEKVGLKITVHGDGLLPDMWRHEERVRAASKGSLEGEEAYKYRRCWQTREYREYSPGMVLLDTALRYLDPFPGARFIDFGCGTGRPAQRLADLGFDVLAIDHASNCMDPEILLPFCCANLWELPDFIEPADYGLCTDVMEHIHEHKVEAVLSGIARLVKKAVFFNIAEHEVEFGHHLGVGALHVTQKKPDWWMEQLKPHFSKVENISGTLFLCLK